MTKWIGGLLPLALLLLSTVGNARELDSIEQRVQPCFACHGEQGRATSDGYYPRIAGKPAGYLYNQLVNFRDGRRQHAMMSYLVTRQSDAYLQEMANYFAGLHLPYPPPQSPPVSVAQLQRGRALAMQGDAAKQIPACRSCHGAQLTGVLPYVPGVLGLSQDYLLSQMGAWRLGDRHAAAPDCMAQLMQRMPESDLVAVTAWLATQTLSQSAQAASDFAEKPPLDCGSITQGAMR